jgi:hypothetical protein
MLGAPQSGANASGGGDGGGGICGAIAAIGAVAIFNFFGPVFSAVPRQPKTAS